MPSSQITSELEYTHAFEWMSSDSPLSHLLPNFEVRDEQKKMIHHIIEALHLDQIALIEAGTGTGKSLAYLLPSLLFALKKKQRILISTHTINLQEQLIHKDIPLLLKALKLDLKVTLVKGMNNYLCPRKLEEAKVELPLLPKEEKEEIEKIDAWQATTLNGSKSDLPFVPKYTTWEKVGAERDLCTHVQCPFYKECPFFTARKEAEDAQLIVVNHSLLFSDLALRQQTSGEKELSILPDYERVIIDEAHHIEEVAQEHFAIKIHRSAVIKQISKILPEKETKLARFKLFLGKKDTTTSLMQRLNLDVPAKKRELLTQVVELFDTYEIFLDQFHTQHKEKETKLRLHAYHLEHPFWNKELLPRVHALTEELRQFMHLLSGLLEDLEKNDSEEIQQRSKTICLELTAFVSRLQEIHKALTAFHEKILEKDEVRWIEAKKTKKFTHLLLAKAPLDIDLLLKEALFTPFSSLILTSATLTTNREFNYFRTRIGLNHPDLNERKIVEAILPSPFNYQSQALFVIPKDIPPPDHPLFFSEAKETILKAIQASRGGVFVLFTSYQMLRQCEEALSEPLNKERYTLFVQGDMQRHQLLKKFRSSKRAVLFGTSSFWEGVDVAGDSLRCVILVKLPFQVPSEPINQARYEAIKERGGNPFMDYSLPNAIVKFKQGFGRLIRNREDHGSIICLDNRLLKKPYGKQFLNSLPNCSAANPPKEQFFNCLYRFYAQKSSN